MIFGIEVLYTEHDHVVRFTGYLRKLCGEILSGKQPDKENWLKCVEFIKVYADDHHHGKEEAILFEVMLEKLGPVAHKMINTGMLVEHNLARYHTQALEEAVNALSEMPSVEEKLDVLTHALSYADLLRRHAEKENNVLFPFALRSLAPEDLERVDTASRAFEEKGVQRGINRYVDWLMEVYPQEESGEIA